MKNSLFAFLSVVLLCSCGSFQQQDQIMANLQEPGTLQYIELNAAHSLDFERGMITTRFFSSLPAGVYKPIMHNDLGVFYLAPVYDFEYGRATEVQSQIGGIWLPADQAETAHVWYLPTYVEPLKAWADMSMPDKALNAAQGMVGWRPYVEVDFQLNRDAFQFVDPSSPAENEIPAETS